MRRATRMTAVTVAAAAVLSGCLADDASTQAGFGLPTQPADEPVPGPREELRGSLHVEDDGCFTWADDAAADDAPRPWIVWPAGGEHDGDGVVLPDGTRVGGGAHLLATGARVDPSALPDYADGGDSYFSSFGGFCGVEERGVVVLDEVSAG